MRTAQALPSLSGLDPSTRARIDNAVLDIFCNREFHRVGLIEIARGANVSLQTLYKYYGSKEALLFSGLDAQLSCLSKRLMDDLMATDDCRESLRRAFVTMLDFFENKPSVMQLIMNSVYLGSWSQSECYHRRELFGTLMEVLRTGQAQGVLSSEVNEKILVDFVVGMAQRLVQSYILRGMKEPLTPQADVLFGMIWRGIAAPSAPVSH